MKKKNRKNFCALGNLTEVKGHDVLKVVLGDVIYIPLSAGKERHYCCSFVPPGIWGSEQEVR